MSDKMAFLLFGDQSLDTHEFLREFCRHGNPSVLSQSFLDQVGSALKEEVNQLSILERLKIPNFSNIQELNEKYYDREIRNSAVDSALLCITQLAHYIE